MPVLWDSFSSSLPPIPEQRENQSSFSWEKSTYKEVASRTASLESSDCESLDSSLSSEAGKLWGGGSALESSIVYEETRRRADECLIYDLMEVYGTPPPQSVHLGGKKHFKIMLEDTQD